MLHCQYLFAIDNNYLSLSQNYLLNADGFEVVGDVATSSKQKIFFQFINKQIFDSLVVVVVIEVVLNVVELVTVELCVVVGAVLNVVELIFDSLVVVVVIEVVLNVVELVTVELCVVVVVIVEVDLSKRARRTIVRIEIKKKHVHRHRTVHRYRRIVKRLLKENKVKLEKDFYLKKPSVFNFS